MEDLLLTNVHKVHKKSNSNLEDCLKFCFNNFKHKKALKEEYKNFLSLKGYMRYLLIKYICLFD